MRRIFTSERMAASEALHFVDLCCGSAMTATFLALAAPKSTDPWHG